MQQFAPRTGFIFPYVHFHILHSLIDMDIAK